MVSGERLLPSSLAGLKHAGKAFALFGIVFATGCSSSGGGSFFPSTGGGIIKIESTPSGAEVYVMGKMVGTTPLDIRQQDVFPNIYPKEKESVYGKVTLRKAGCADFTKPVSSQISSAGLRAQLDCGDIEPASPKVSADAPRISETAEQRLEKIRDLLNKGLISEDEAKKARERVINEL